MIYSMNQVCISKVMSEDEKFITWESNSIIGNVAFFIMQDRKDLAEGKLVS